MHLSKNIRDNLHFLIAEVGSQVGNLHAYIDTSSPPQAQRIVDRSGYAYNLKMRIHNSCLGQIVRHKGNDTRTQTLRAAESIATDLERIAELCRNCIHQMAYLKKKSCLRPADYARLLDQVSVGLQMVQPAIQDKDTGLALKLGQIEHHLDRDYRKLLKHHTKLLKKKQHTEDLIAALFVAHSIEQMGDALLNISEAIISANLGQPINIDRYYHLMESIGRLEAEKNLDSLTIKPVAETRSGSAISGISNPKRKNDGYVAIFKDGKKRKLKEEREGVESWHEIYPGLAPKILSYHKRGQSASLLIEHLAGMTFEHVLLRESQPLLNKTMGHLCATLESVWRETRSKKKISANYMDQLAKRLPDVYEIHPEFRQSDSQVCGLKIPSFESLLKRSRAYETRLKAPFSVYIHGDFNVDNIIYDPLAKRINFIDLHRSRYMDYVQDVSVFMVSNYRLQVLDAPLRRRIMQTVQSFYRFARKYAKKAGDETFELRLALGLARSFATSTRFILDKSLARAMMLRARYLLERVLETDPKQAANFQLPIKELFIA
ncbi:MAG: phosphotransferase [gamma proteobacterium endosymbiont of Lamellibrachia anaximandri]|nr:phosphotransferase [gamma proteobacterium endosymbiont of Lamellibrachia anaximandri]MBL3617240.1 phosphotransferase [gamma proteobacterium endosymbiont of Lamellibrachia anaximandri]